MDRRDRARGALLGLACGDAVGTTVEFKTPGSFDPVTDMVGGGPFGLDPGQWTDDTSLALCLAESLVDVGGHDPADQLRRYSRWRHHGYLSSTGTCFDIGLTTASAIGRFEDTGLVTDAHVNQEKAANGSLMRLAPVAIRWSANEADVLEMAAASSITTHPANRPVDACRVYAAMTAAAIEGATRDEVLDPSRWGGLDLDPEVADVVAGSWRHKSDDEIRGTGFVVHALEASLWAIAGADDFADAVLRATNLGDDADTTAAITGQLAGALWGMSGIPSAWRAKLTLAERMVSLADRLHDESTGRAVPDTWAHDDVFHAWWVEPGWLLAGEYPGSLADDKTRLKVDLLADAGIRTIIDLTADADRLVPYVGDVEDAAHARGIELLRINVPILDLGVTSDSSYDLLVATIEGEIADERPVFVHCWGGIGRTGTVIGRYLATHGDPDPIATVARMRAGTRKADRRAPETDEQVAKVNEAVGRGSA